ncbi:MAG: cell envelope integrity protein CreD, partial [Gammaproteobacteria bacterium]|nr:cell envelope integrity protein CreD [Gammaproteobacteria bacterium]
WDMQQQISALRRSSLVKVAGIGILILVLLIPLAMTRDVIHDRSRVHQEARSEIMRSWGGSQLISGPILVVPYVKVHLDPYMDRTEKPGEVYFLPEELSFETELETEIRYRGIHEVPVYTANMTVSGRFAAPDLSNLGIEDAEIEWARAYIALPVSDARAIRNAPEISIAGQNIRFEAGGTPIHGFSPQIVAVLSDVLDDSARSAAIEYSIDLDVGGTGSLQFLPIGNLTNVEIRSSWQSPSFSGNHLPETREIRDDGFEATWRVSSLSRALPARWTSKNFQSDIAQMSAFGIDLFQPVGLYQLSDRATKYGILFIGLTFVAYFLFEVLVRLRLHPLHYLLVGFGNVLFYLLLLSFSEHIGFGGAYLLSSLASTSLVTTYSSSILGSRQRAMLVAAMLVCLYGFLYLTLNAESYAMLAGSIGLWVSLALVMYLTRNIDWYRWGRPDEEDAQTGLFD